MNRMADRPWWRVHPDLAATLCLFLTATMIFAPPLLLGRTVSPANLLSDVFPWRAVVPPGPPPKPALTDITQVFHPWLIWAGEQIRRGVFPFWNPHAYTGAPFFGNGQSALLFPLTLLPVVLPAAVAVTVSSWLKLFGTGLATYWFLRTLTLAPLPALTGAWTFMLSATVIGWLQWTFASTFMFLPALLAATEHLRASPGGRRVAILAILVAFDVLAGYPQAVLHGLIVTTAWALCRFPPWRWGFVARYAVGVGLGVGLAAVQLLPFAEYVRESLVFAYRGQWTLPWYAPAASAVTFVMPYFYGAGAESWGRWQFGILTGYCGVASLALLPVGVLAAWRHPGGRFVLGLGTIALALHYGAPGVAALAELPGLSLGTNLRLMPLVALSLATVVGFAMQWLRDPEPARRRLRWVLLAWFALLTTLAFLAVVAAHTAPAARAMSMALTTQYALALGGVTLAAVLAARALAGGDAPAWVAPVLAVAQLASLAPLAATYNSVVDRAAFYPSTPALEYLQRHTRDTSRVLLPGHLGLVYGLFEAHGYDGLTPRRIAEVAGPVGTGRTTTHGLLENVLALHGSEPLSGIRLLTSPVLDLAGVRYILLRPGAPAPRADLATVYDAHDGRIFRNDAALPRAFLVGRARCVDDRQARRLIAARAVDFRREVLLADCETAPAFDDSTPGGTARIARYGPHTVRVEVAADRPAYLVLTDTWYPGWTARLDGGPVRLWRANHAFRAVSVPPGEHVVEFTYEPSWLALGLAVTTASLVAVGAMLLTDRP